MQDMSGRQDKYLVLREDGINRIIIVFHAVKHGKSNTSTRDVTNTPARFQDAARSGVPPKLSAQVGICNL
jgi:hypothetical protein